MSLLACWPQSRGLRSPRWRALAALSARSWRSARSGRSRRSSRSFSCLCGDVSSLMAYLLPTGAGGLLTARTWATRIPHPRPVHFSPPPGPNQMKPVLCSGDKHPVTRFEFGDVLPDVTAQRAGVERAVAGLATSAAIESGASMNPPTPQAQPQRTANAAAGAMAVPAAPPGHPPLPNPLRDLHKAAGAEFQAYGDLEVVSTFGEPQAEYAAVRKACALFDLPQRGILELTGKDRLPFLNNLLTNQMWNKEAKAPLAAGQGVYALLLNKQGRVIADLNVIERG